MQKTNASINKPKFKTVVSIFYEIFGPWKHMLMMHDCWCYKNFMFFGCFHENFRKFIKKMRNFNYSKFHHFWTYLGFWCYRKSRTWKMAPKFRIKKFIEKMIENRYFIENYNFSDVKNSEFWQFLILRGQPCQIFWGTPFFLGEVLGKKLNLENSIFDLKC